jgi:hypothetical protein
MDPVQRRLTDIDLQHRGRMYHSQHGGSPEGVVCGSERQNRSTILSGQIRVRGLCISARGSVGKARSRGIHRDECWQYREPFVAEADSRARMLSAVSVKLEARFITVAGRTQGQRACKEPSSPRMRRSRIPGPVAVLDLRMAFRGSPKVANLKKREGLSSLGAVRRGEPEVEGTRQIPVI